MNYSLIVAVSRNNAIGAKNKIPWKLKSDLELFKNVTMGCPIIMGRKTFESIGRCLPGRLNIVLSKTKKDSNNEALYFANIESMESYFEKNGIKEAFIIGGAKIYEAFLSKVTTIHLSEVMCEVKDADTFFPELPKDQWNVISKSQFESSAKDEFAWNYKILKRNLG
jgi:dihydrofolate reductase